MPPLRASQVETLRAVEKYETPCAQTVACELNRWPGATMRSLNRLDALGFVKREWESRPGSGQQYCFYRLTQLGREALEGSTDA
jgi:predicted transcriptional regulator